MSEANSHENRSYTPGASTPAQSGRGMPQPNPNMPAQRAYSQPPTYQMPIAVPTNMAMGNPNYGGTPGNFNPEKKRSSKLLIAGIIILILALVALAVAMLFVFKPFGLFEEEITAEAPSIGQVENMIKASDFEEKMLGHFQFVNTEGIQDPTFKNTKVGQVTRSNTGNKDITCEATSDVELHNNSITATTTLTMQMTYDKGSSAWKAGDVQTGNVTGKPEGPADIEAIQKDILSLLRSYDSSIAAQFANSEITNESALTKDGGTAAFTLTKTDATSGETKTCTVNTELEWNDSRGWQVKIASVDGLEAPEEPTEEPSGEQPADDSGSQNNGSAQTPSTGGGSGGSGSSSGQPTMLLVCYSGDLVQVPGVIEFDGSRVLLKTDHIIRVEFDNRVYITTYFELTGNGGWHRGEHTTVIGEISATGSLAKAPLVINVDYD